MRWLALLLVVASTADAQPRFQRFTQRTPQGRNTRGLLSDSYAFLEFAPADGAGMPAACSSTAPTGAKGETLTFARGSGATCTKTATGGLVSSGIANGDLVELSSNVARVEYDSGGVLGLLVEGSGQNVLTRFIDYANASWSDVGTPTLTGSQTSPFSGTYATSAVLFSDNDGAAFEGRSIPVAVSAGSAYIAHCYVKAGTATSARIALDGTAATITGLSSSTWSIVEVADASASGASITLEVDVGSTTAVTGTVVFGGCDVKLGTYRTSIVPTVAAAVTRSAETATLAVAVLQLPISVAWSSAQTLPQGGASNDRIGVMTRALAGSGDFVVSYFQAQFRSDAVGSAAGSALNGGTSVAGDRWATSHDTGGVLTSYKNGTQTATNTTAKAMNAATIVGIGASPAGLSHLDGVVSRVCVDPSPTRCR